MNLLGGTPAAHAVLKELGLWPPRPDDLADACRCLEEAGGDVWTACARLYKERNMGRRGSLLG
jgi:hypothetical protein